MELYSLNGLSLPPTIKQWKEQLLEGTTGVFGDAAKTEPAGPTVDVKALHAA
jgi:transposase